MTAGLRRAGVAIAAVALMAACSAPPLTLPRPASGTESPRPDPSPGGGEPQGVVRVAYPNVPARWGQPTDPDLAGQDLQALWGLPLVRMDPAGQLRTGLVTDWRQTEGPSGSTVMLSLAPGEWSDGRAVTAADVVATLEAARRASPETWADVVAVTAEGDERVALTFATAHANWPDLLLEAGSVLPAHVLEDGGIEAYHRDVPVAGGWFRLVDTVPGLSATFEAHVAGPLGAPALERVEVVFAPRYETALGLLEGGEVDALVGYTALNPVGRAREIDEVEAAAPLGGTWVAFEFSRTGAFGEDAALRQGVTSVFDVEELVEGLLGPVGAPASTPWHGVDTDVPPPAGSGPPSTPLVIVTPAFDEVAGFTGRALQRDLTTHGVPSDLISEHAPEFAAAGLERGDAAVVVRRDPRFPALVPFVEDGAVAVARQAHARGWPSPEADEALRAVVEAGIVTPLYRVGVLHAWQRSLVGMRPSAWPGTGFWNVGEWALTPPEPA